MLREHRRRRKGSESSKQELEQNTGQKLREGSIKLLRDRNTEA